MYKHKQYLLTTVLAAATLATVCTSCDKPIEEPAKTLTATIVEVENGALAIAAEGGSYKVTVKAENVEWKATLTGSENFSIEGAATGKADAEFTLAAAPNTVTQPVTGTLTVSAEGTETVTFTLNQEAAVATVIWDNNSLYFAHMHGPVKGFDTYFDGIHDLKFDASGRLSSYGMKAYFESTGDADITVSNTYDDAGRISGIESELISFVFTYGDHGRYIEVGYDVFEYNEIEFLYLFQSSYLKNLVSIEAVEKSSGNRMTFDIQVATDGMVAIECNGNKWSDSTYGERFIETRTTAWNGEDYAKNEDGTYKKDENGKYIKQSYSASCEEKFDFNTEDGRLVKYTTTTDYMYEDGSSKTLANVKKYNSDHFNTLAKSGNETYLYDEWGDWTSITGGTVESTFSYQRDSHNNWTSRREVSTIGGQEYTYNDTRKLEYY